VAIIAGLGDSEMTAKMNHYIACRAEAAVCREKSETNVKQRDYWLAEAQKWEKRAKTRMTFRSPIRLQSWALPISDPINQFGVATQNRR
jgi:hypothetical protein